MDVQGYEPLLDSKWTIPFVAILVLLGISVLALLRIGIFLAGKRLVLLPRQTNAPEPNTDRPLGRSEDLTI